MRYGLAAVLSFPVLLTGCGLGPLSGPTAQPGVSIQGTVHGGQQPIAGAHIYLLAANTSGYGGPGIAASSSNASQPLLQASSTGTSDSIGAYVTSAADGTFSISGDYTCTPDTQVYLYALGGNSGAGNNTASALMAALGNCPGSGNFASATPYLAVNELTTVAAAYAMAGFATDATHVSSSGTGAAVIGIRNAFANAVNLVDLATGKARSVTPGLNGTVPQQLVNTLGDILASCINSNGSLTGPTNATACYTLFQNAKSAGSTGTVPTDTATAAINIAHNPGANISMLFGLPTAQAPFGPQLSVAPNDFTVGISYTGGGLDDPVAIAIDKSGNVWVADHGGAGAITELAPNGNALSPVGGYLVSSTIGQFNGIAVDPLGNVWLAAAIDGSFIKVSSTGSVITTYSGTGIENPWNLAIDGSGNVWATDCGNSGCSGPYTVDKVSNAGTILSGANGLSGNMKVPLGMAIDASGNAWAASRDNNILAKFSNSGTLLSGAGITGGGLNRPYALAVDHSGNIWVASYGNSSSTTNVTEFSNSGTPLSPSGGYQAAAIDSPDAIAIDGDGRVWVACFGANVQSSVVELANDGSLLSPSTGYQGGNVGSPNGIAIDGAGNVWTSNPYDSTVTQLIGAASPVVTPLSIGVQNNTLGVRP